MKHLALALVLAGSLAQAGSKKKVKYAPKGKPTLKGRVFNQNFILGYSIFANLASYPKDVLDLINKKKTIKKIDQDIQDFHSKTEVVSTDSNSCSEVCAADLSILKEGYERMMPENGGDYLMDFLNEKSDFAGYHQRTLGYCWGHTSMTRNFNYLAHWDLEDANQQNPPSKENLKQWKRFYQKKIRSIMNGKAQIIPGYANLREFTADIDIQTLTKHSVVRSWGKTAISLKGIPVFFKNFTRAMKNAEIDAMIETLQSRLDANYTPKIFMANLKNPMFMHIISVIDIVKEDNGNRKVCILDNHEYEEDLKDCGRFLEIYPDGRMFYTGWDDPSRNLEGWVRRFGLTPEDNIEMLNFVDQKAKMCRQITQCK
jgi:hypothetical protein